MTKLKTQTHIRTEPRHMYTHYYRTKTQWQDVKVQSHVTYITDKQIGIWTKHISQNGRQEYKKNIIA